jgi:hypothetical protein
MCPALVGRGTIAAVAIDAPESVLAMDVRL